MSCSRLRTWPGAERSLHPEASVVAVGRLGDVINGEHYGPETTFLLGVRNSHPEADVPSHAVAYHSGGTKRPRLRIGESRN